MIRGVIFDVGGTLIWTNGKRFDRGNAWRVALTLRSRGLLGDAQGFAERLEKMRRNSPKEAEEFRQIGTTGEHLRQVTREFGLELGPEELRELEREFVRPEACGAVPLPGSVEAVQALAGRVRLGIASNTRSHYLTEAIVGQLGLGGLFDPLVTSVSVGYRKPSPRMYEAVLDEWGLPPEQVAMVGDSLTKDVAGPRALGIRGIWLTAQPLADRRVAFSPRERVSAGGAAGRGGGGVLPRTAAERAGLPSAEEVLATGRADAVAATPAELLEILEGWGLPAA